MGTLVEQINNLPDRIKRVKLYKINGQYITTLQPKEVIEQYCNWNYSCGYSDSMDTVSIWVYKPL